MKRFHLALSFQVSGCESAEEFEEHLDCVVEQLPSLHGVIDPDLGAELETGIVTFTLSVDAETPEAALATARAAVRTAIHATGNGCTPAWEAAFADAESVVTPELVPA